MRPILSVLLFVIFYVLALKLTAYLMIQSPLNNDSYLNKHWYKGIFNLLMSLFCIFLLRKSTYFNKIGLGGIQKLSFVPYTITLPLTYAVIINLLSLNVIDSKSLFYLPTFTIYCLSVGLIEEIMFRGYIQNQFVLHFGKDKKGILTSIIITSIIFGTMHFIRFDKGIYGETAQFCYAFFIGLAFGVAFYKTQRIYPLIITHALIDFVSGIDKLGNNRAINYNINSFENSLITIILMSPYLCFALYHFRKLSTQ